MGSTIRRLAFLWTLGAAGVVLSTVILVYSKADLISTVILTRLAIIWLVFLIYFVRVCASLRTKGIVASATDYVSQIYDSDSEYCLILRPFGADGFITVRTNPPRLSRIVVRIMGLGLWRMSKTVEQIIGETVNEFFNCETIALVDPKLKFVPASPTFISTDDRSWQKVIELLLKRALVVFLILPPQKRVTPSVLWEMERIAKWGLVGRFVIVLPPPDRPGYKNSYESVKELADLFPIIYSLGNDGMLIWPYLNPRPEFNDVGEIWRVVKKRRRDKVQEFTYVTGLSQIFTRLKSQLDRYSCAQRYLYSAGTRDLVSTINKQALRYESKLKPVHDDDEWPELIN